MASRNRPDLEAIKAQGQILLMFSPILKLPSLCYNPNDNLSLDPAKQIGGCFSDTEAGIVSAPSKEAKHLFSVIIMLV